MVVKLPKVVKTAWLPAEFVGGRVKPSGRSAKMVLVVVVLVFLLMTTISVAAVKVVEMKSLLQYQSLLKGICR